MIALPPSPVRSAAARVVSVSPRSLVQMEGAYYSVPCGWVGLALTAYLGPSSVEIVGPDGRVAHPRLRFGQRAIRYRHYLP